ncbi:unnamed protein product [Didymodactylos carnosus]|uniref:Leishmanolysin-like peptidase n=1 Tax=Didymodactylos carnosus TaxID=1234261 RepID=A0A814ZR75_9BILA|nr:unnamed protein product [Didymodactylos carnosus]CAF1245010.1 unnamed protein product [Didymodactylos carnosus]CAF3760404.1 unnamed protein product [Didymodactylos carnosus]CAF4010403.1 unnamed protein product [Didymodactylos carnosus]
MLWRLVSCIGKHFYPSFVLCVSIFYLVNSSLHYPPNQNEIQHAYISSLPNHDHRIKRSLSDKFNIHVHYDKSIERLSKSERSLIKNAIDDSIDYWSRTIRPKYKLIDPIHLTRACPARKVFIVENDNKIHYCDGTCASETKCGDVIVPENHLELCYVCDKGHSCKQTGKRGDGIKSEFLLYVSALQTTRCESVDTLATASFCQLEFEKDRPISGNINICPQKLYGDQSINYNGILNTIRHEILHTLAFSSGLFAFFRDQNGNALTERDPLTRWPKVFDEKLQVYKWDNKVAQQFVRENWKIRGGSMNRTVWLITTPKVKEVVREHFNCSTLEGAELEDQGSSGTALTHWEKRLFEHEIMTGTYTQESVISNLTLALLEDSGWYDVSYDQSKPLLWGKNSGCDFVKKSCKEWIDAKLSKNENPSPYCVTSPEYSKRICSYTHDTIVMCNLVQYSSPIPAEYQIFDSLPNVTNKAALAYYGGHVSFADYCPYNQELSFKNSKRDSRCYLEENQPLNVENYALEQYSSKSKCFNHGSVWNQYFDKCQMRRRITLQTAGCYQFECVESEGIYIHVGNDKYHCEYAEQNITIQSIEYQSIYVGSIICPQCEIFCGTNFKCPKQLTKMPSDQQKLLPLSDLCVVNENKLPNYPSDVECAILRQCLKSC